MRFLCDEMLLRLARLLRAAGYDTYLAHGGQRDAELLEIARTQNRVLVTRDKRLAAQAHPRAVLVDGRGVPPRRKASPPPCRSTGCCAVQPLPGRQYAAASGGSTTSAERPRRRGTCPVHFAPARRALASTGRAAMCGDWPNALSWSANSAATLTKQVRSSSSRSDTGGILNHAHLIVLAAAAAAMWVSGCNTVAGMGRDVAAVGHAVSSTADDAKH